MKVSIFLSSLFLVGCVHAQEAKNTIGVELFQPLKTSIVSPLTLGDGLLLPYDGFSQKAALFGVGLCYGRKMSNGLIFRVRPGVILGNVNQSLDYYYEVLWEDSVSSTTIDIESHFKTKKVGFNLGTALLTEEKLTERFSILFGVELTGTMYLRSKFTIDEVGSIDDQYTGGYSRTTWAYENHGKIVGNYGITLAPVIVPTYRLTPSLSASFELQTGITFNATYGVTDYDAHQLQTFSSNSYEYEEYEVFQKGQVSSKLHDFSWSKVSPIFRLTYAL